MRNIAVVGAGWAGCAAAVELVRRGERVTLFESSRTLGGRARRIEIDGRILDNGQHILLGAYTETLRVMKLAGIDPDSALLRLPLQMRYPPGCDGMDFVAPRLPAPLHMMAGLWRAKGLQREDKLALARFSTAARWMDWTINEDCSVTELLERFGQTERLTALMWRPLCIAALNTPPDRASAQVFLNVLRDSLGARRSASDMLLPRVDLTSLFPARAADFVCAHGGTVHLGSPVDAVRGGNGNWLLDVRGRETPFDAIIVATSPHQAAKLLECHLDDASIARFEHEPITTCYLQYAEDLRLSAPFYALVDRAESADWGQFVFDRGWLDPARSGLLAVVVSASDDAIGQGHESLAAAIANQLQTALRLPGLSTPLWTRTITEKRATFSCVPSLRRPPNATGLHGLAIAGDYTAGDYPATIESAARSGVQAARSI